MRTDELRAAYASRLQDLEKLSDALEAKTKLILRRVPHVDRVQFRAKSLNSFMGKIAKPRNPPYRAPLVEVEDQVAGRVLVFFRSDIDAVCGRLQPAFNAIESKYRQPPTDDAFDYESHHLVCTIPVDVEPEGWREHDDYPRTFELQVRTLFMHAWSEPQHDIGYKSPRPLPSEMRRELALAAAAAWGADRSFERIRAWHEQEADAGR